MQKDDNNYKPSKKKLYQSEDNAFNKLSKKYRSLKDFLEDENIELLTEMEPIDESVQAE